MWPEFKGFLLKTNALALAVGVVIGGALGTVVDSLVTDVIMAPVGLLLGGIDFANLRIVLKEGVAGDPATEVAIRWGSFVNAVIAFVVIAFVVWQISRSFLQQDPTPEVKACPFCRESNAPEASRCKACTSAI